MDMTWNEYEQLCREQNRAANWDEFVALCLSYVGYDLPIAGFDLASYEAQMREMRTYAEGFSDDLGG